jgi:hypothetical protein
MLAKNLIFCMLLRQNRSISELALAENGARVYRMGRFEQPRSSMVWSQQAHNAANDTTRFHM